MKLDFTFHNPTRVHFGKDALSHLQDELKLYGDTVLFMYGKRAIKEIGLYDQVIAILKASGKKVVELSGIKPNPSYAQLLEGVRLVREHKVDLILAVGGGSTIDCAKAISASAYCEEDPWTRYWIQNKAVNHPHVPVGAILTMVGTGSEMNGGSVITNEDAMLKNGHVFEPELYPKFAILNPEYTFSVSEYQMASGIFDTMSHLMEQYFSGDDDNTSDYVIEGIMRSLIHSARIAMKSPTDYEARSNIMWCATLGLNYIAGVSKTQDWEVHMIEHQIGAYTDCTHGAGLAAVSLPYYRYISPYGRDKFVRFAQNVWGIDTSSLSQEAAAEAGIAALGQFIRELKLLTSIKDLGVTEEMLPLIAQSTIPGGGYKQMEAADILAVLKAAYL